MDKSVDQRGRVVRIIWVIVVLVVIMLLITFLVWNKLAEKRPGAFNEEKSYKARVMVNVFTDANNSKNYSIPADIHRKDGIYYVLKIYWPDGGYIEFKDKNEELDEGCRAIIDKDRNNKIVGYCLDYFDRGEDPKEYIVEISNELAK